MPIRARTLSFLLSAAIVSGPVTSIREGAMPRAHRIKMSHHSYFFGNYILKLTNTTCCVVSINICASIPLYGMLSSWVCNPLFFTYNLFNPLILSNKNMIRPTYPQPWITPVLSTENGGFPHLCNRIRLSGGRIRAGTLRFPATHPPAPAPDRTPGESAAPGKPP